MNSSSNASPPHTKRRKKPLRTREEARLIIDTQIPLVDERKKFSTKSKKGPRKKKTSRLPQAKKRSLVFIGCKVMVAVGAWLFVLGGGALLYYSHDLPDISKMYTIQKTPHITILDNSGNVLTHYGDLYDKKVHYEELPLALVHAVVATEDRNFFKHRGVDFKGLLRAMMVNFTHKAVVQGGSTITQQLAKNIFFTNERNLKRKIQELLLALYIERHYTKEEILTMYLNRVYMGAGIYGVGGAAKFYFGKDIHDISLYEAALITGLLKAPSKYSPLNNTELSGRRTYQVLLNMYHEGFITDKQVEKGKEEPLILHTAAMGSMRGLYFTDWIMESLPALVKNNSEDLVVHTTLHPGLQYLAELLTERYLAMYKPANVSQLAMIVMDRHGRIVAMVGGNNYRQSPFNRATKAKRQPGSAFKIFVYAAAFENGMNPSTIVEDGPITIKGWSPRNVDRIYHGTVSLKEAFAKSINTIAVKVGMQVGLKQILALAQQMGINSALAPHPSTLLGAQEVSLLELTNAYKTIANKGIMEPSYGVVTIQDSQKKVLYSLPSLSGKKVLSDNTVRSMQEMLKAVIEEGTGKNAMLDGQQAYGKTGTSQDFKDAWFVGYTDLLIAGVWLGNDDNAVMKNIAGGSVPAMLWREFMTEAANIKSSP